jgi:hypothetical protein
MSNKNRSEKYLTEMKELPPSRSSEEKDKDVLKEERQEVVKEIKKEQEKVAKQDQFPVKEIQKTKKDMSNKNEKSKDIVENVDEEIEIKERLYTYKDVILGVVNFISIVFFVILIINFPKRSQELKSLKIQEIKNETAANMETNEIDFVKPKTDEMNRMFLDESGIVNFVNDVELQKTEGGAISKVSFASQKAVTDKTGNYGVPIVLELTGNWEAIDADLQKIDTLPYLFRPVKVEIGYDEENPEVVIYKYGIFLYVKESLGKNR